MSKTGEKVEHFLLVTEVGHLGVLIVLPPLWEPGTNAVAAMSTVILLPQMAFI